MHIDALKVSHNVILYVFSNVSDSSYRQNRKDQDMAHIESNHLNTREAFNLSGG